jgi:sec-independent protein translocase protein TatB
VFEIGFWELVLISIIALFVFGPERLPGAIRTVSRNIRSVRNMMDNVKHELTREISAQEAHELPPVINVNNPPVTKEMTVTESDKGKAVGNHS